MLAYWKQLSDKVEKMNRRERILVLLCVIFGLAFLMKLWLLDGILEQRQQVVQQLEQEGLQRDSLALQLQQAKEHTVVDPNQKNRERLQRVRGHQQRIAAQLRALQADLVSPAHMPKLLADILSRNDKLELQSLKTLVPEEIESAQIDGQTNDGAQTTSSEKTVAQKITVYQHGFELTVSGGYLDMLQYLQTLEQLPWNMMWDKLSLTSDEYPQTTMVVTIHTLSLDKAWMSL